MQSTDDSALLRQYAENNSDEAFAALVTKYIYLVYSVAMRGVGNPASAQEITQAVFIILARKAGQLRNDKALSSWLFQTTRLTANNFLRSEMRRQSREQEAHDMQTILNEPEPELWPKIAPLLDNAVAVLKEKDRRAVLLRFYEGRNLREIGAVLGASEDAAEKRVNRALEKLRKIFAKRGVSSTTAILSGTISANSVQAAPIGLAKTISAAALAKGTISVSILSLAKTTMETMTWFKFKTSTIISIIILLVGSMATVAISRIGNQVGSGSQYQVEGIVSETPYELDGTPREDRESRIFDLCVSNNVWEMTLKLTDETQAFYRHKAATTGRQFDFEDYVRLTFDGTDLYDFMDGETSAGKYSEKMRADGKPIPPQNDNRAEAVVTRLEVPHQVEGDSQVWLAYASSHYFQNVASKMVEASWRWGFPEVRGELLPGKSIQRRATWTLEKELPHLPEHVTYFFGNDDQATNAQFTVQSWTTFENLTLPQESTLDVYRFTGPPNPSTNISDPTTNTILSIRYVIKTTAIKKLSKGIVTPPLVPVLTAVLDSRFNGLGVFDNNDLGIQTYYKIQDRFLTKEQAQHWSNFVVYNYTTPITTHDFGKKKHRFIGIIIGIVALFSVIVLALIQNQRRK